MRRSCKRNVKGIEHEKAFGGVDVGSVSTNLVINEQGDVLEKLYLRSEGNPIKSVQKGLAHLGETIAKHTLLGVGVTGSGRQLIGRILGADLVKNEITAHGMAGLFTDPTVKTIIEIGGQDSKLILVRQGTVVDFAMNTVCAAGTDLSWTNRYRPSISIGDFGAVPRSSIRCESPGVVRSLPNRMIISSKWAILWRILSPDSVRLWSELLE